MMAIIKKNSDRTKNVASFLKVLFMATQSANNSKMQFNQDVLIVHQRLFTYRGRYNVVLKWMPVDVSNT